MLSTGLEERGECSRDPVYTGDGGQFEEGTGPIMQECVNRLRGNSYKQRGVSLDNQRIWVSTTIWSNSRDRQISI